jgi:hypothetical protein
MANTERVNIEYLSIGLRMAGVNVDERWADMIQEVYLEVKRLGGKCSINEISKVIAANEKKYNIQRDKS